MKLSLVISAMNQVPLTKTCFKTIVDNISNDMGNEVQLIIIDNASDVPLDERDFLGATIIRNEENIGVYPTFQQGMDCSNGDVVAFFHSDVIVWEKGWNNRVIEEFEKNPKIGLIGFIGSDEIDSAGGRGGGTMGNFQGNAFWDIEKTRAWKGSEMFHHGKTITDYKKGAVVDGCVMILKRQAWNIIGFRENFGLHHFYDKLISCQILEAGFEVGVLGIAFDHVSGQTVNQENNYQDTIRKWAEERDIPMFGHNWDNTVYNYSESMWLKEYRDEKHLIPIKI